MAEAETKSVADVLREARKLIEKPEAWTQGQYGVEDVGDGWTCLCTYGAICEAQGCDDEEEPFEVLASAAGIPGKGPVERRVINWNDAPNRAHAEVLAAFDAAIALAEESQ